MESYHRKQERLMQDNSSNSDVVFNSQDLELMLENIPKENDSFTGSLLSNMKPPSQTFVYNKNGSKKSSKENSNLDLTNNRSRKSTHTIRSQKSYVYRQNQMDFTDIPSLKTNNLDLPYDLINTDEQFETNLLKTINNDSYINNNLQNSKNEQFNNSFQNDDNILGSDINPILKTINKFSQNGNRVSRDQAPTQKVQNNNYLDNQNLNSMTNQSETRIESFQSPSENKLEKLKLQELNANKDNKFHSSTSPCFQNDSQNSLKHNKECSEKPRNNLHNSLSVERKNRQKMRSVEVKDSKSLVQTERVYYKKPDFKQQHNFLKKKRAKIRISHDEQEITPKNTAINTPKNPDIDLENLYTKSQAFNETYGFPSKSNEMYGNTQNSTFNSLSENYGNNQSNAFTISKNSNLSPGRPNLCSTEPVNIELTKKLYIPMKNCKMNTQFDLVNIGNDQFILANKEDYYTLVAAITMWRDENFSMNDLEYLQYIKELKRQHLVPKLPPLSGKKLKSNMKLQGNTRTDRVFLDNDPFQQNSITVLDPEKDSRRSLEPYENLDYKKNLSGDKQTNLKKKLGKFTELRGRKNSNFETAIIEEEVNHEYPKVVKFDAEPESIEFLDPTSESNLKKNSEVIDQNESNTDPTMTAEIETQPNKESTPDLKDLGQNNQQNQIFTQKAHNQTSSPALNEGLGPTDKKNPINLGQILVPKGKQEKRSNSKKKTKKIDIQKFMDDTVDPTRKYKSSQFGALGKMQPPKFLKEYKALPTNFWKDLSKENQHQGVIANIIYFIGNQYIFTRDNIGYFKQWSTIDKTQSKDWREEAQKPPICFAASCDNKHLVYTTSNEKTGLSDLQVWQIYDPTRQLSYITKFTDIKFQYETKNAHESIICCVMVSWDCQDIFTSDGAGVLKQWGLYNMHQKGDFGEISPCAIFSLAQFRTNVRILVGSADGSLREYHTLKRVLLHDYGKVHEDRIMMIKINKRGRLFFSAADDLKLKMFNSKQKQCIKVFDEAHNSAIHSMFWSDDQEQFWTIARDNTVKEWDVVKQVLKKEHGKISEKNQFEFTEKMFKLFKEEDQIAKKKMDKNYNENKEDFRDKMWWPYDI